ncbi:hypothetical protein V5O48_014817 [Marasmius crinis-equi]|uniref:Uncharacterized protein n=1 Tax=Marasmius crinis-equi TaxID=585013 RepID=A0ABR3EW82_9AGAR
MDDLEHGDGGGPGYSQNRSHGSASSSTSYSRFPAQTSASGPGNSESSNRLTDSVDSLDGLDFDRVDLSLSNFDFGQDKHPCQVINKFALALVSSTRPTLMETGCIAFSHDEDWMSIMNDSDAEFLDKTEVIRRMSSRFKFVVELDAIFPTGMSDAEKELVQHCLSSANNSKPGDTIIALVEFREPEISPEPKVVSQTGALTRTSPNQPSDLLPFSPSWPSSHTSPNSINGNGGKRARDDPAGTEKGEISPCEHRPSSSTLPPKIPKRFSGIEEGEIAESSGEKPSKVAKRYSGDDVASSSSSIDYREKFVHTSPPISPSSIPSLRYGNSNSNEYAFTNLYITPYSGNSILAGVPGLPLKPQSIASSPAPVEASVFPDLQHAFQMSTLSKPVSFRKSISSSVNANERKEKEKEKDEEPKLGLKHFRLLYEAVGKVYVCRECKSDSPPKHKTFPLSTAMPEMVEHSWKEHPEWCKEVLNYSPSKLTEEQMLLKEGSGMMLKRSTGIGARSHPETPTEPTPVAPGPSMAGLVATSLVPPSSINVAAPSLSTTAISVVTSQSQVREGTTGTHPIIPY